MMEFSEWDPEAFTKWIEEHQPTPPDDPKTKIWRYMDFVTFVSMLTNKGLFFRRASTLNDPFEGSTPQQNIIQRRKVADKLMSVAANKVEAERQLLKEPEANTRGWRNWVMVNCWHMNDYESAAMWDLYGKSKQAIAIQSTYEKLAASFPDGSAGIGIVRYIDYQTADLIPEAFHYTKFLYKRKSFEHERELRAFIWKLPPEGTSINLEPPDAGKWKNIDLDQLFEKIYIAPQAEAWFKELVENVLKTYGLEKQIEKSDLDSEALY